MTVNSGSPGTEISLQDLQDAYGGSHPISLSEYYRGGVEVPSTAISGNNPYTGQTSASGSGSGSGGGDGIAVNVTNRSTTSGGGTSRISYTGNEGGNNNRPGLSTFSNVGSRGDSGATLRVSADTVFAHLNYSGSLISNRSGYRVSSGSATITSGQVNFRGPAWTSDDGNSSFPQLSSTGEIYRGWRGGGVSFQAAYVDQRAPQVTTQRRQFVFTNNTGQRISLTTTAMGGNSRTATLNRGETIDTGTLNGGSEAWTYSYSIQDAGSGSGTGDETNAGVVTDVTVTPGMSTTNFPSRGSSATLRTSIVRLTGSYTVQSTDSILLLAVGGGDPDSGTTLNYEVNGTRFSARDGNQSARVYFGGPAGGYTSASSRNTFFGVSPSRDGGNLRTGDVIRYIGGPRSSAEFNVWRATTTTTQSTHDISFRNTNSDAIIMSPSSTGGSRTLNSGQTAQVVNDRTGTSSWEFQYRYAPSSQPANTAIPETGEVELDQFNTPGNFAG